ncbi:MAG: ImmA/IrrE family metallo-endopeptidase [Polyangiaceae bacterium]|jgi:Zn-dependent peptidase ImmA (M78 family)/transcriptional regulator with XRE-family HTH domain|nr:ImmA/IrrE family metallo-endopeptidase [Polyangiaceae bacterium]
MGGELTAGMFSTALRRQREGLTSSIDRLAELSGLLPERIRALEGGQPPTTSEVAKLASALAVDPAALWRGEVSPARTTARFRAPLGVPALAREDASLLARAAEAGRIVARLSALLGRPVSPIVAARRVLPITAWPEPWEQGYKLGAKARHLLHGQQAPIASMARVFEQLGVHVARVTFQTPDIFAASLYEPGAAPVVLLNQAAPRVRAKLSRRAVLAHELCHLLHDGGETDLLTLVSRGNDQSPHEQRANAFAPGFVVPGGWLEPHTTDARALAYEVASRWGLSFEGAAWHLKNAGKLSNAEAEEMSRNHEQISDDDFELESTRLPSDKCGVAAPAPLASGLLSDLAVLAYEHELISKGRTAEILELR